MYLQTLLLHFFEVLACLAGFYHWNKLKKSYWKWFPVYLLIILINEFTGKYLASIGESRWNNYFFQFWGIPLQFLFFFWLFSRQRTNKSQNVLSITAAVIYIASIIVQILFFQGVKVWYFSFSYTVGNLLLVILILNYLLKFINSDEILFYKSSMMFWVAVGLAIFYLGSFPFFALRNTLYYEYRDIFTIYNYVQLILSCLMYLVFSLAFIWGKPK